MHVGGQRRAVGGDTSRDRPTCVPLWWPSGTVSAKDIYTWNKRNGAIEPWWRVLVEAARLNDKDTPSVYVNGPGRSRVWGLCAPARCKRSAGDNPIREDALAGC